VPAGSRRYDPDQGSTQFCVTGLKAAIPISQPAERNLALVREGMNQTILAPLGMTASEPPDEEAGEESDILSV